MKAHKFTGKMENNKTSDIKRLVWLPFVDLVDCQDRYYKRPSLIDRLLYGDEVQKTLTEKQVIQCFNEKWLCLLLIFVTQMCAGGEKGKFFKEYKSVLTLSLHPQGRTPGKL